MGYHQCFLLLLAVCCTPSTLAANCQAETTNSTCIAVSGCEWLVDKCVCSADVKIDFLFVLDNSGSIGRSAFQIEKNFLLNMTTQSLTKSARIGFVIFATRVIQQISLRNWTETELKTYITNIAYVGGSTNTSGALQTSMNEYNAHGSANRQKILLLFTDGNPCMPKPTGCPYSICYLASAIKMADIRVIVVGVGPDWDPEKIDCLVQDIDSDIIPVGDFTPADFAKILPQMSDITCPVSYSSKITEVKTQTDATPNGARFVEIYNDGSSVAGSNLSFHGFVNGTLPAALMIQQSQFLVLYNADDGNLTCEFCDCDPKSASSVYGGIWCPAALYFPCSQNSVYCQFNTSMTKTDWHFVLNDSSALSGEVLIDAVVYDSAASAGWIVVEDGGYTYELTEMSYDNDLGTNWQQSCDIHGTPGDVPIYNCTAQCTDEVCQGQGAPDASCNVIINVCICPNGFYPDGTTCKPIPHPAACVAYILKNESDAQQYVKYNWTAAQTDVDKQYSLLYWSDSKVNKSVLTYDRSQTVVDYDLSRGALVAGVIATVIRVGTSYYSSIPPVLCEPITQSPTESPTNEPTMTPTAAPSAMPTPAPTYVSPWVYVGGALCLQERCECYHTFDALCCVQGLNFEADNCTEHGLSFVISSEDKNPNADSNKNEFVTLVLRDAHEEMYPSWRFTTTVHYQFTFVKMVNLSADNSGGNRTDDGVATVATNNGNGNEEDADNDGNNRYMAITPARSSTQFVEGAPSTQILFKLKQKIVTDDTGSLVAYFRLSLLNCTSMYEGVAACDLIFPKSVMISVALNSNSDDGLNTGQGDKELPQWLWWLIAVIALLLIAVALFVYRYWKKNKQKGAAILSKDGELQDVIAENEMGFGASLNPDNVAFNPMAAHTGMTAVASQPANPGADGNAGQFEKADVVVEKFGVRQEFGAQLHAAPAKPANKGELKQHLLS